MGKSIPVRYIVEMDFTYLQGKNFYHTPTPWPKQAGRVNDKNLAKVVAQFVASLAPGACNDHLSRTGLLGVSAARVYDQFNDRKLIASWRKP
jgi:hypothetical protein